jgi:hypothetical protein
MRAYQFIVEAKPVEASIIRHALAANMTKILANAALKSIPFAGPLLGFYFAAERYRDRPDDYVGMALEVATGFTGSLGGALSSIAYIVARDCYYSVVQEMKKQTLVEPEYLQLSGNFEQDLVKNPKIANQLRKQIADNVQEEMEKARAKANSVEAQSKLDRNLMPSEYDSGPLKGWTHPMVTKAFNQRSATGREYK